MTYADMFKEIAQKHSLSWELLVMQAYRESGLNPRAVGAANDTGLMQIIPSTWNEWAPRIGVTDPFDPYSNVSVGAAYLAFLRQYFAERGYPEPYWGLVAYNWGPGNLRRHLDAGGKWGDIPAVRRKYASDIILRTEAWVLAGAGRSGSTTKLALVERLLARPLHSEQTDTGAKQG